MRPVQQLNGASASRHQAGFAQAGPGHFILADGTALTGDYGRVAAERAGLTAEHARQVAENIRFPRAVATRTLETDAHATPSPVSGAQRADDPSDKLSASLPQLNPPRVANQAANQPASEPALESEEAHASNVDLETPSRPGNVGPQKGAPDNKGPTESEPRHEHEATSEEEPASNKTNPELSTPERPAQREGDKTHVEVVPKQGVVVPRTSIGTGHPNGDIAVTVTVKERGEDADLTPLLPATQPPVQYVKNPEDGDHYHRTSVYAASGLPLDVPAHSSSDTWTERMHLAGPQ